MDADQLLSLVLGAAVATLGASYFPRLPSGRERWVLTVSYLLFGVLFALWPPQTGVWLDHTTGIAGLGMLAWACATTLAVGLQVTMNRMINERRLWWVRAAPLLASGSVAAYIALWVLVRQTAGSATSRLLYDGYHGDRPAVLVWNLLLAVSIACVTGLAAREQLQGVEGSRPLKDAVILGGIYIVGVGYGFMIAGQALASRMGYGATTIVPLVHVLRLIGIVLATGLAIWTIIGIDLWTISQLWWRVRRLEWQGNRLTFLLVVLSDRLVWRHAPGAAARLARLARLCTRHDRAGRASGRQILIGLQAARRITWRRGVLIDGAWDDARPDDRAVANRSIAAEAALDVATGSAPISDIGQVILLVLADVSLPAWLAAPLPEPTPDHVAAAALLAPYFGNVSHSRTLASSAVPSPSSIQGARGLRTDSPSETRGRWVWIRGWHRTLSARHAQAETNLMVCCELIEDYVLQIDASDDNDLAISVWTLDSAQNVSPFQVEIAQRSSQILALFGPLAVRCAPWPPSMHVTRLPSFLRPHGHRPDYSHPDLKVILWCSIAMVTKAVLDPACVPVDGAALRGGIDNDGRIVAGLIREAAQGVRQRSHP